MSNLWNRLNERYYNERTGFTTTRLNEIVIWGSTVTGIISIVVTIGVVVIINLR